MHRLLSRTAQLQLWFGHLRFQVGAINRQDIDGLAAKCQRPLRPRLVDDIQIDVDVLNMTNPSLLEFCHYSLRNIDKCFRFKYSR